MTRSSLQARTLVLNGARVSCTGGIISSERISGSGCRCLSTWTPSTNISIVAIRMTTTVRIERIETYNKNATVLPSSSMPQKANSRIRMRIPFKTRAPTILSTQPERQFQRLHNRAFDFSYELKESVYASPHPQGVQIQYHSFGVDANKVGPRNAHREKRNLKT